MAKIFPSPGVSSRPLNLWERLVEQRRQAFYPGRYAYLLWKLVHPIRWWRIRQRTKALVEALSASYSPQQTGEPLKIESLQVCMQSVTFNAEHIKLNKEEPLMKVTVGRIVHYQSYGTPGGEFLSKPRAAIVTEVNEDGTTCSLNVVNPTGYFFNHNIPYSDTPKPGHWNWPPRDP